MSHEDNKHWDDPRALSSEAAIRQEAQKREDDRRELKDELLDFDAIQQKLMSSLMIEDEELLEKVNILKE